MKKKKWKKSPLAPRGTGLNELLRIKGHARHEESHGKRAKRSKLKKHLDKIMKDDV